MVEDDFPFPFRWDMFFFSGRRGISFQLFLSQLLECQGCTRTTMLFNSFCWASLLSLRMALLVPLNCSHEPRLGTFFVQNRNPLNPLKTEGGGVVLAGEGRTSSNLCYVFFGGLLKNGHQLSLRLRDFVKSSTHIGLPLTIYDHLPYQNQPHVGRYTIHGRYIG